ncbi:MAG: TolC family protein, partial [Deltaproteobacteria bacterium]|nr:TolC family protein [Deltaproteobacteria bacterium]
VQVLLLSLAVASVSSSSPTLARTAPGLAPTIPGAAARAAATAVDLSDGLSPEEAVTLALAADPQQRLRLWQTVGQQAQGRARARSAWSDPELRLQQWKIWEAGSGETKRAASLVDDLDVALRWRPPVPGLGSALADAGEQRFRQAGWSARRERQQIAFEVLELYLGLLGVQARQVLAMEEVELRRRMAEMVRRQIAAGSATGLAQSLTELDAWDSLAAQRQLAADHDRRWRELAAATGLAPGSRLILDPELLTSPCTAPAGLDEAELVRSALDGRPDLAALRHALAAAEAELLAAQRSHLFWPSFVQLSYGFGDADKPDSLLLGLAFALPLLGDRAGELLERSAERDRWKALLEAREQEVAAEIGKILVLLAGKREELLTFEEARPAMESALELVVQAITAGHSDLLPLATVKEREMRIRRGRIAAQVDCCLAWLQLQLALGKIPVGEQGEGRPEPDR